MPQVNRDKLIKFLNDELDSKAQGWGKSVITKQGKIPGPPAIRLKRELPVRAATP